jgi:putative spermidine/putrescine transport system substrate-binding protein
VEFALLADGVPRDQVYKVLSTEEGLERAINKIRELKPHVAVWWKSGAQHAQLMKDGEVDMTSGWNGRFDVAKKDGAKVSYTFEDGLLGFDCFAIPKGAPNEALAMKFLAKISTAEMQANLPLYITYGPANKASYSLGIIDDALARSLPSHPDNAAQQLATSAESLEWYINYDKKASAMFQDMLTE